MVRFAPGLCGLVFAGLIIAGCSGSEQTTTLSAEDLFQRAKAMYDEGDYLDAINEFTIITLQYQGSAFADDAQFYLGECRFARGEFLLASFEYQQLRRSMPASPLVPDAQYKIGLSYYNLSPKSALDQQYTLKAIDELQTFVEYYPSHAEAPKAEGLIKELTKRLALKAYEIARQYMTLQYYKAAGVYFDVVIEKYHDTEYAPLAYIGKVEALIARKRYAEADAAVTAFLERYPDSVLRARVDGLKKEINEELNKGKTRGAAGDVGGTLTPRNVSLGK